MLDDEAMDKMEVERGSRTRDELRRFFAVCMANGLKEFVHESDMEKAINSVWTQMVEHSAWMIMAKVADEAESDYLNSK